MSTVELFREKCLGANPWGELLDGSLFSRWELFRGNCLGVVVFGRVIWDVIVVGGNFKVSNCPGDRCPGGNFLEVNVWGLIALGCNFMGAIVQGQLSWGKRLDTVLLCIHHENSKKELCLHKTHKSFRHISYIVFSVKMEII